MDKHDEGRRAFLGTAIGAGVAASIVGIAEAQARTPAKTILAVAVGDPGNSETIYTEDQLTGKRPYIKGIIDKLKTITVPGQTYKYALGNEGDYVIDYREFAADALDEQDNFTPDPILPADFVIFAMSTTVAWNASRHETAKPIVAIVSNAKDMGIYANNICGVSGKRSQFGRDYYDNFYATVATPAMTKIYVLMKEGYAPCLDALRLIEKFSNISIKPTVVNVPNPSAIESTIKGLVKKSGGLLVLPADWFFAKRQFITEWARQQELPDFWPVTDWIISDEGSPLGGWGVSQQKCGELLGEQIAEVWKNGIPSGGKRWLFVKDRDAEWKASKKAADKLGITLGPVPNIIP
jgi:hypothetical protein